MKITRDTSGKACLVFIPVMMALIGTLCFVLPMDEHWKTIVLLESIFGGIFVLLALLGAFKMISIDENGIKSKKASYSWDNVVITVHTSRLKAKICYHAIFSEREASTLQEEQKANKNGILIALNVSRLHHIKRYYKNKFVVVNKLGVSSAVIDSINHHNNMH